MPPRKRRTSSADKAMANVLRLLEKHGKLSADQAEEIKEAPKHDYRTADAVVVFAHQPKHFVPGICKECKRPFAHNRPIAVGSLIGFCSDACRRDNWKKTTGVPYSAISTSDIWGKDVPLMIDANQFDALKKIAEWFTTHQAMLQIVEPQVENEVQEIPEQPIPDLPQSQPQVQDNPQVLDDFLASLEPEPVESSPVQKKDSTSLDDFFDSL